jgi:hypothetical protein
MNLKYGRKTVYKGNVSPRIKAFKEADCVLYLVLRRTPGIQVLFLYLLNK